MYSFPDLIEDSQLNQLKTIEDFTTEEGSQTTVRANSRPAGNHSSGQDNEARLHMARETSQKCP